MTESTSSRCANAGITVALGKRARILCIEDDLETSKLIEEELRERGFSVTVANSGEEGLSLLLRSQPDLVLSDINMPAMTGFDVLENLANFAPRFANIPFIFLTALTDRDIELRGRKLGADDYITKPIDFDILEVIVNSRLKGILRTSPQQPQSELSEREITALMWTARGKTSDDIAVVMNISKRTVDFHLNNARTKLGATNRIEAAVKAAMDGLIEPYAK